MSEAIATRVYDVSATKQSVAGRVSRFFETSFFSTQALKVAAPRTPPFPEAYLLAKLSCMERTFKLNAPIEVLFTRSGSGWIIANARLGIAAFGVSKDDAITEFQIEFSCCWDAIALEDPANLTVDAQRLRARLRSAVSSVLDTQ